MAYGFFLLIASTVFLIRSLLFLWVGKKTIGILGFLNALLVQVFQGKKQKGKYLEKLYEEQSQRMMATTLLITGVIGIIVSLFILSEYV